MMREVKRSQERFCRDVQGRIDKTLAARHLPPRDAASSSLLSQLPQNGCIDTTQVVPSLHAPAADTSAQGSALAVSRPTPVRRKKFAPFAPQIFFHG